MPRSTAVFTGSGFAAFETVVLKVKNLNQPCNTVTADSSYLPWSVVADENGAFVTSWTVCDCPGDSLRLKAQGQTSGLIAYAYFTDASLNSVSVGAASQAVNYGTAAFVSYTVSVKATGGGSGPTNVTLTATGLPVGVTIQWSSSSPSFVLPNIINFTGAATVDVTLLVIVQNNTDVPASPTFTATATAGATTKSGTGTLTINRQPVTGSITASDKVYDGNATATILTRNLTGILFGDAVSLIGGTATFADKNIGAKTVTATGLSLGGAKAGNYILGSTTATTTASITAKALTAIFSIADKPYDGGTTAAITDRQLVGVISGEENKVNLTGGVATFSDKNVGVSKTVTVVGPMSLAGTSSGNYTIGSSAASTASITFKLLTISFTVSGKVYDGNTTATITSATPVVVFAGDDVTAVFSGATATFNSTAAGTQTVTASGFTLSGADAANGNYQVNPATPFTSTADITPKTITVTFTASNKVYDGGVTATIATRALVGVVGADNVSPSGGTASFDNPGGRNVGNGKPVTATGFSLTGAAKNNYSISPNSATALANITPRGLTVTAQTDSRIYNGTTSSAIAPIVGALQTGDVIGTAPTQAYNNRNVGTGKTLTASGLAINDGNGGNNYTVTYTPNATGVIAAKGINVIAQTDTRIYNGTTSSGVAPVVDPLQTGDVIGTAPAQTYNTRNVGTSKILTASGLVINDGNSGNNYSVLYTPNNTGVISVRGINVTAQTDTRVYNGTTSSGVSPDVDPLQTGDVIGTAPTQAYDTRNTGASKILTAGGLVINDGNGGNNYNILYTPDNTGAITARDIDVTAQTDARVYNGTASSAVSPVVDPLQTGDVIGTAPTQAYDTRNIGTNKGLAASGLVINDGNSGNNYSIHYNANNTGVINARDINVNAQTDTRVYNGTAGSSVAPVVELLQTGDVIGTAPAQSYNNRNVGTTKTLTASGLVINDGNSGNNYTIHYLSDNTGVITARGITVTAQADTRVYNGTTSSVVAPVVDPLQTGDVIGTAPVQSYDTRNVGASKVLTATGLVINDGNSGNNYNILYTPNNAGVVNARGLYVTAQTDNRIYNGTTSSAIAPIVGALQAGDVIGTAPTQSFNNRNVGTGKTLTASGLVINDGNGGNNYTVSYTTNATGMITARSISVNAQTDNRIYNGTASSGVAPVVDALQTGDVVGTAPTQSYNNRNVGAGKTLTASGLVINDGNGGNNYTIAYTANATGVISARDINVTAQTDTRVYNGTASSAIVPVVDLLQTGDAIGTAPAQSYNNKNAGTGKTLTASGLVINDGNGGNNYSVHYLTSTTGVITAKDINVTAQHDERIYNATVSSAVAPVVEPLQTGDLIGTFPIQKYDTKNVGISKILTPCALVINDGNGGLNYSIHYLTNLTGIISEKGITGNITASNKVYDGTTSATIVTRTLIGVIGTDVVSYSGGTATFDDVPVGTGKNVGNNKPVTATGLSLTGGDATNYTVNSTATTIANITQKGLIITADNLSQQYSDPVVFTVNYAGFVSGEGPGNLGGTLAFTTTPAATTGASPVIATGAPGPYTITPGSLTSSNYAITFKTGVLTITKEDAKITYTGLTLAATTGTATSATLTLSATIQDITAALSDPAYDVYPGDIRKATVTFTVDGIDVATVPIGLVNSADTKTGTAVYNFAGAGLGDHTIALRLNGYYASTTSGDNQLVVEVYQATGDFITGGGYLKLTNSSGLKAGDAGTKNNFGFNIKYNKGGTNLQGTINTIVRRMEGGVLHVYQVKGNSMTSLTVNSTALPPTAVFNGKANITDITNPASPLSLGGNSTLQVSMTDAGEPGTSDKIGIVVYNNSGGIWFSSNWDGIKTVQQTLGGGNLLVHSSSNVGGSSAAMMATVATEPTPTSLLSDKFSVKVHPTVSESYFTVNVQSNTSDAVQIKVYDIIGRQVEMARGGIGESIRVGYSLAQGTYILRVRQGNNNGTIVVSKF